MFPEILVPLFAIGLGGLIVLIPVLGLTVRFAIKPLVDSWVRARELPLADERMSIMERRIALLETQIEGLEHVNSRLLEEADFNRKLQGSSGL